ncbi:MAG TPA: Mrp/NBP35 family ATP-binding protein [Phycisphaerae bacterium]|nr:Mrp/NBP35 family ATP-binding protein [Phycisphaerae bacterium]
MPITEQQIYDVLKTVQDPDLFKDLVTLRQVKSIKIVEGNVAIEIATPSPQKDRIRQLVTAAVSAIPGVDEVFVNFAAALDTAPAQRPAGAPPGHGHSHAPQQTQKRILSNVKHIVAVGAGKGGVGKSTIAVNLAIGLALAGKKVALLDGDIYGPSIPTLTGIGPRPPEVMNDRIIPFTISNGIPPVSIKVMSIGFMVDKEKALIWRGPMAHGAMKQFLEQVDWESDTGLDYLIIDLPPGTGDIALTLAQTVALTGAVIVATPQEVALADARRAVRMFQQLGVEILGVVENMSAFICEHGTEYDIFGRGGAQVMAQQMGLPYLGDVPITPSLRINSDAGKPFDNFTENSAAAKPLRAIADLLDKQVAVRQATRPAARPLNLQIT